MKKFEFLEKARNKHGYKYNYLNLSEKIRLSDKIQIELNGELFTQTVSKHLMGRCPEKKTDKKTTDEFIKESKRIWGDKYDYSLTEYNGSLNTVKIIYDGVVYEQRASSHLEGMAPEFRKTEESIIKDSIRENENIGKLEISKFLDKFKIQYQVYRDGIIQFDFFLPKIRKVVEFRGIQHFETSSNKSYLMVKENDKKKEEYCEDNIIDMIVINYDQIEDVYQILWDNLKTHIKTKKTS